MGEKLIVGPINKGLRTDREAFVIDNDSFPVLINAYQWRGRILRKRGTRLIGRLSRFVGITNGVTGNLTVTINPHPIPVGIVSFIVGSTVFYDPGGASPVTLLTNGPGTATLNRTTGVLTILGAPINTAVIYLPTLPVMGLEDFLERDLFLGSNYYATLAFDTRYAYAINGLFPYPIHDISFYKNPPTDANLPGYVPKGTWTSLNWNGEDYQQFWTVNYQGALWVTNGINVPFIPSAPNVGMQFAPASTITYIANTATTITLSIVNSPLVVGDFVFLNEWTQGGNPATTLNNQSGYVTAASGGNPNVVTITLPFALLPAGPFVPGIVQYLTNRSDTAIDCIRWYDGDPTDGSTTNPIFLQGNGWVNFTPPLSNSPFSIGDAPAAIYYLVGARLIVPFHDRLIFMGVVIQTSNPNIQPIYLQDTIVYSQNGTPYYTASFNGDILSADTVFSPILVPDNQTATANAWFEDETGFGGNITAGVDQPIISASTNQDVIIVGFSYLQTRLVFTGNDVIPFIFYVINSEYGTSSTFSTINMDKFVLSRGTRGFIGTSQTNAERIDLPIIDKNFEVSLTNNGSERICAQRDFISEWVYFTYPVNDDVDKFPNQTLQYNYRDDTWAIFKESYTTYGAFRPLSGLTWATIGMKYPTWSVWNDPWNAGVSTLLQPLVIAGNQQGFVISRDNGTGEEPSLTIQNIAGSTITSPNHTLNQGDYLIISGVLGSLGSQVNGKVFSVGPIIDANNFILNPTIAGGTYLGGGVITRLFVPFIQTKQFPMAWGMGRKTRLGPQQYLLSTTPNAQITLLIYLSMDATSKYNDSFIVPSPLSINNSLVYSTVLFTCPESTNLGLTPSNTNLQQLVDPSTGITQAKQMWHRINTSLIGDTVQVGFTMSDSQMRTVDEDGRLISQDAEIELHGFILDCSSSMWLS